MEQVYCTYGGRWLSRRVTVLTQELPRLHGAQEDDQAIHDVRVATRRLRTALSVFSPCLPQGRVNRWDKAIRRVTKRLGQARDLDVQIAAMREVLDNLTEKKHRPGVNRLLLRLRQRREELQARVVRVLNRLERAGVIGELEQAAGQILARAELHPAPESPEPLYREARTRIAAALEEMLSYVPFVIGQPKNRDELHRMRISAKHLRYTMEVFEELHADALPPFIKAVRQVQQTLGDIHDADVWIDALPAFLDEERRRVIEFAGSDRSFRRLRTGIEHLKDELSGRRDRMYKEFLVFWTKSGRQRLWEKLLDTISAPPSAPAEEGPPAPAPTEELSA